MRINADCSNCQKGGVKYVIKKTGTINLDDQFIILNVNKKGEHQHLTSSKIICDLNKETNNGETINDAEISNNAETSN